MVLRTIKDAIKTILSILRIIKHSKKVSLPASESNDIYVLGNGPSVKEKLDKDQEFFLDKKVFCVNFMVKADFYDRLKPQYYVLCDWGWFSDNVADHLKKQKDEFLDMMIEKTKWEMYLFLPFEARKTKFFERLKENPKIEIVYFNTNAFDGFKKIKYYAWKKNIVAPILINVLIAALFLSINMGYKKIYLLGAESSWFKYFESSHDNLLYMVDGHCYDNEEVKKRIIYGDQDSKVPIKIHEEMYAFFLCFREYHEMKNYAKLKDTEIFNITPGSFIDAFPKISLD